LDYQTFHVWLLSFAASPLYFDFSDILVFLASGQTNVLSTWLQSPGTQAALAASVRPDADDRGKNSSSRMQGVTPEEPALQARAARVPVGENSPRFL